jgi:hypothetical protein
MRLLRTSTFKPEEFFGANIPHYAILSHRWEDSEVTFKDVEDGSGAHKRGWSKIKGCCAKAAEDGWDYAASLQCFFLESHANSHTVVVD